MSIDKLINFGFKKYNESNSTNEKTIVVIGAARGGTSMVAGILYHLGVPMGKASAPVFEDVRIANAFETNDDEKLNKIIIEYNKNPVWGFKRPGAINYLEKIASNLRNPHFVFIFRDVFSIANRNGISMGSDLVDAMKNAIIDYDKMISFIAETNFPCLLCSSEKVNAYPKKFVETMVEFTGMDVSTQDLGKAIDFVNPESIEYINASRINRTHGQIGQVKNNMIHGWAAWFYRNEPAPIEVYINGKIVAECIADEFRPHLVDQPKTREGYCGYSVDISHVEFNEGDELIVKVKSDVMQLKNSPWAL